LPSFRATNQKERVEMTENDWTAKLRGSATGPRVLAKVFGIFCLGLMLLIPLGMIESVLGERRERRDDAIREITSSWGPDQTVIGPVLAVPYRYTTTRWEERAVGDKVVRVAVTDTATSRAFFLPRVWNADGAITPHPRYRGIYKTVVYSGAMTLEGEFDVPDYEALQVKEDQFLWDEATVSIAIPDLRGAHSALTLAWGDTEYTFTPGTTLPEWDAGVHCDLRGLKAFPARIPFRIPLTFNGKATLLLAPLGIENVVRMRSTWPDPGFRGGFLPIERTITEEGFDAKWSVSHYGRTFPQFWTERTPRNPFTVQDVDGALFGVELVTLVDSYRNVERSIKYGILFLTLVFTAFFLFETLSGVRIHGIQYLLVGAALCLFYLLLLSLSEVIRFVWAYLAAATAATVMISLYTVAVLKSGRRATGMTCLLALIYGFLYVTLQLQDYSLLTGTAGLTIALAVVMYATRNIDWYAEKSSVRP
jgi:inner membrane protein